MLLRYNERISLKCFDSQDDGYFILGEKGAPISSQKLATYTNQELCFNLIGYCMKKSHWRFVFTKSYVLITLLW